MSQNDILLHPKYQELLDKIKETKEDLAQLILKRDELSLQVCNDLEIKYIIKFGVYENKIYELSCAILRIKRKIELVQQYINQELPIDLDAIEKQLDIEFEEYQTRIKSNFNNLNNALKINENSEYLSEEETKEMKKLYKEIVMKLHPDLNPDITDEEKEMFLRTVESYKNGDLEGLRTIHMYVIMNEYDMLKLPNGYEVMKDFLEKLNSKKNIIISKLFVIIHSFPYDQRELLNDEEACNKKIEGYKATIDSYEGEYKSYEEKLNSRLG